ncbi:MAG: DegV family protein [Anaerolineales bacterium]|nr:DegV family protein [Anaerolineales bacterium]
MSKVAVVTDSTAYLPKELVDKYGIKVGPQVLIWGEETYRDGIDIQPTEFYQRLEKASVMPSSSQVAVQDFKNIFEELHNQGFEVLAVLISDLLSGTIASAEQARELVPGLKLEIVNSRSVAMAEGFQVLAAARAAQAGASLAACKQAAEAARERTGVVFAVDTLEFLHRGGRIGGAQRFLGTALKLKPILEVRDGRVDAVERVRTSKKAHARLVELVVERANGARRVHLATLHANAPDEAHALLADAQSQLNNVGEIIFSEVSPVVGTHAGPGTVGLAYYIE